MKSDEPFWPLDGDPNEFTEAERPSTRQRLDQLAALPEQIAYVRRLYIEQQIALNRCASSMMVLAFACAVAVLLGTAALVVAIVISKGH